VEYYVVRDTTPGHAIERLVPRGRLNPEATPVRLDCTLAELGKLQPLNVQELQAGGPSGARGPASYGQAGGLGLVDAERAPDGTGVLRATQDVEATNGKIGKLSGVVIDDDGRITHFYTRLDRDKSSELFLPASAVLYVDRTTVYLQLDKHQLESLPPLPALTDKDGNPAHKHMELLARVYDTPGAAAEALSSVRASQEQAAHPINIREVAVLSRDGDGPPKVDHKGQSSTGKGAAMGLAAGGLLAALGPIGIVAGLAAGGAIGGFAGSRIELGLPDAFLKSLQQQLKPDHSALILLVERDPDQDPQEVQGVLDGAMSQSALVDSLVQNLLATEHAPVAAGG